ncbi:uncharacterized protein LOC113271499 isoform X2 [Papaver somniferum]|uniref:uncharacterized protein LOC113271499 isoform X2 n=1 Tax=Papaver somniferum TaxID=3469 RepID=UPI000E704235|nr:uncharacterized protein LOC113271499 isoform X2 [Papaver somniferum]
MESIQDYNTNKVKSKGTSNMKEESTLMEKDLFATKIIHTQTQRTEEQIGVIDLKIDIVLTMMDSGAKAGIGLTLCDQTGTIKEARGFQCRLHNQRTIRETYSRRGFPTGNKMQWALYQFRK